MTDPKGKRGTRGTPISDPFMDIKEELFFTKIIGDRVHKNENPKRQFAEVCL